ncbi:neurogenic locus notch-like protein 4 [Platysternon megacephalum]|uniref:Neurogenic locus notch-like protein 4 n=1 Tax=Platysternon megacephalum TaxID=55544 RepID=A0A4D9DJ58_9SAUR|nr:neurogenic locus notch-like protein 4 [Platysternon megacephalum]
MWRLEPQHAGRDAVHPELTGLQNDPGEQHSWKDWHYQLLSPENACSISSWIQGSSLCPVQSAGLRGCAAFSRTAGQQCGKEADTSQDWLKAAFRRVSCFLCE